MLLLNGKKAYVGFYLAKYKGERIKIFYGASYGTTLLSNDKFINESDVELIKQIEYKF